MAGKGVENFESRGREDDAAGKEGQKKPEKVDTLFYRRFDQDKHSRDKIQLKKLEENNEKTEKIKERFTELALLLSGGKIDTPVNVAGENHWLELDKMEHKGKEEKPVDLIADVEKGLNPAAITVGFKLVKTEGRPESLYISLKVSAARILEGGGELKEDLFRNITDIFGGTDSHYEKIRADENDRKKDGEAATEKPVEEKEKDEMAGRLEEAGAEVSVINSGGVYTIVAEMPQSGKKIMVSLLGGKEPWMAEMLSGSREGPENFSGPPGEVLSEIYKFIEKEQ